MHFSRPSGCRLRMCRPWYRGAGVGGENGSSVVTTLRNMCAKVTPKPLNEPVNVPTSHLLGFGIAADRGGGAFGHRAAGPRARGYLQVHRWDRETARWPGGELFLDGELP